MISVPVVVKGELNSIHLPKELECSYVIPINWKSYSGAIVICLECVILC